MKNLLLVKYNLHEEQNNLETILNAVFGENALQKLTDYCKGKGKDGKDLELVIANSGEWAPGTKLDAVRAEFDDYKQKAELYKSQTEEKVKAYETLSSDKNALTEKLKNIDEDYNNKILNIKREYALIDKLKEAGLPPINEAYKAYYAGMDLSSIVVKDDNIMGVAEVVASICDKNKQLLPNKQDPIINKQGGSNPPPAPKVDDATALKKQYEDATDPSVKAMIIRQAAEKNIQL